MDKVTVVIPTYNRFKYLMNTIQSVKEQTHTNLEIIVVNDCSTETDYYEYDWNKNGVRIIHLPENSKTKFGFACPGGYQRNFGIKEATGEYIAFCDDDDTWFPQKLELQLKAMKENDCKMSCTDGLFGRGVYDETKTYKKYNKENYFGILKSIYKKRGSDLMDNGFPTVWTPDFFKVHNCAICRSMMIKKEVIDVVGDFIVARANEDYEYWRRAVQITNCVYVDEPCVYYDASHGAGQNY
jgi:glycosyltransferase involved in cell wall biosynthesis